jgi:acyl-CoA synthetase (AMP-forming)/AMP-acid ligase II
MRVERSTIRELVAEQAQVRPQDFAILAPARTELTFSALWNQIEQTRARLRELGIQRGDIVASALPNGPDAATAVLAVSSIATVVPLNPDGTKSEYDSLFLDLTPKVLLIPAHAEGTHPAAFSARGLRIPVVGVLSGQSAGVFTLEGRTGLAPGSGEVATPEDFAYILTTSGTTARPKLVPMPHRAACLAASISAGSMLITSADRSLNVSPLFHSLGLVSGLFAALREGGSVVCLPGLQVTQFFDQLVEYQATWFAAVPTMLQSIAEHAPANREKLERSRLRVIRTAGAALAPEIAERVERDLRATIVHVYGMSEAPCIAGEQYPVEVRKPGSVGRASHQGVAIVDENGQPVSGGTPAARSCCAVRGLFPATIATMPLVPPLLTTDGSTPATSATSTGTGFCSSPGRRKEFINRGGEKVAPVEVDEVLLSHPAVVEAVTFAVPDARLGEEIAAGGRASFRKCHLRCRTSGIRRDPSDDQQSSSSDRVRRPASERTHRKVEPLSDGRRAGPGRFARRKQGRAAREKGRPGSPFKAEAPEIEQKLAAIFARVLKVPHVGPER